MDDNLDMADDLVNFILPESVVAGVSPVRNGGPGSFIGDVPSSSHAHPQGLGCSQRSSHDGSVHMKMVEGDLPGKAKVSRT